MLKKFEVIVRACCAVLFVIGLVIVIGEYAFPRVMEDWGFAQDLWMKGVLILSVAILIVRAVSKKGSSRR